jgi:hypothetical protein
MALHRIVPTRRRRSRRRLFIALLAILGVPLAGLLSYRIDEAPSGAAQSVSARPARTVPDADNAWLYLTGLGAAEGIDPVTGGRAHVDAYLAGASRETLDAQAVPEVKPDPDRDGFTTLCRPSLGNCSAWALQHRAALLRLVDANRLRLTRLDKATALMQWQEPPLSNENFPPVPATTIRLQFAALALQAGDGGDPVALGQELARHAALWRRASEQSDWLISKMIAVSFLADSQRLLVETYARAAPEQRRELDAAVDAALAAPSAAAASLDLYAYDVTQMGAVVARAMYPGLPAAFRYCWYGDEPKPASLLVDVHTSTCNERLVDNLTFLPQATTNRYAPFADAARTLLAAAPAEEADARRRYDERIGALRADLKTSPRLLPARNDSGERFVQLSLDQPDPMLNYRRRLNDYELLRRVLAVRVAALRADVDETAMDAFLGALPAALRHPYPDKAIRWDGTRGAFFAPTAVEGMFDEDGLVLSYRR